MPEDLTTSLRATYPELERLRGATSDPVYVVGGAVRDLLLGRPRADLDLVVVGDAAALAEALGGKVVTHESFATAKALLDGHEVDIATARTETYPRPGALPEVAPAIDLEADLVRRDFTINAMAVAVEEPELIDPTGGRADLDAGVLRVLHPRSFVDDPTRALRAARYAARFGFTPEPESEALLRKADLITVSADRREAELLRLAAEPEAARGFELLDEWGLLALRPGGAELARGVADLLSTEPWTGFAPREPTVLRAAAGPAGDEQAIAETEPASPSQAVELAGGREPIELVIARALGAEWLDRYVSEWRQVALDIDGEDLIAAGVPEGPRVGRGLDAALRAKLDGELDGGRDAELEAALAAARGGDGLG